MEKKIKKIIHFDLNNQTDVKITKSLYLLFENKTFYKNGKQKGGAWESCDYYFFDNQSSYNNFMAKYGDNPQSFSNVKMVVSDGLKYNAQFLTKNLNKI